MHLGETITKRCLDCKQDFKTINPFRLRCFKANCNNPKNDE